MDGTISGKRILVVEDEYFIASDIRRAIEAAGGEVVGPVGGLDKALALVADEPIDAAVLDVNLEGVVSYPIADRLNARGVPCMFLTGYDDWSLLETYRAIPRLAKPFPMRSMLAMIEALLAREVVP